MTREEIRELWADEKLIKETMFSMYREHSVMILRQKSEAAVSQLLKERFGIDTTNLEEVRNLVTRKRLELAWLSDSFPYGYIGVIVNNRWLYTFDGKVIGKKGKNFDIEGHKFTFNIHV